MANVLPKDKQITIISALAEGSSMRAITRMTGIHRDTVCRLGVHIGQGCARLLDEKMRNLECHYLQFDELWGFIDKKQKHVTMDDDPTKGDVWTFCAIDAETKLVPAFRVGKRDHLTANAFVSDVASRLVNRPQISTDGLRAYLEAVENAFGMDVDYGMVIKNYGHDTGEHHQERRYSE
jgi:transposase-like protein